jgi:hypothetical protein
MNRLQLAPLHRAGRRFASGGGITERDSLDFVVDGGRLSERIPDDVASCLGWGSVEWEISVVDKLLLLTKPDFPIDRYALYICPECGDFSCGVVSASIRREGDVVVWRDFGWQNDYEDRLHSDGYGHLGPFYFNALAYESILRDSYASRVK